jgi:hypothetical protein
MDGTGGKSIRDRVEARFFDPKDPFGTTVITNRLAAEFTADPGGRVQTTERRLRTIIAQAAELGANQHRAFVEAERVEGERRAAAAWPSPRWREGLRRLYLVTLGAWGLGLAAFVAAQLDRRPAISVETAFAQWAWGMVIPAAAVFALYRACVWIGRGFRRPRAPRA